MKANLARKERVKLTMATKKRKTSKQAESALTSAAQAVGASLGRLALKVGVAAPPPKNQVKRKAALKKPTSVSAPTRTKKAASKKKA
jgi:hypothetical protein